MGAPAAICLKNVEALMSYYTPDILLYDLAPPLISPRGAWSTRRSHDCRPSRSVLPHDAPRRLPPCPGHPRLGSVAYGGIEYTQESFVDAILRPGDPRSQGSDPEELQAALAEPRGPGPSGNALAVCEPGGGPPAMGDDVRRTHEPSITRPLRTDPQNSKSHYPVHASGSRQG